MIKNLKTYADLNFYSFIICWLIHLLFMQGIMEI